MKKAILLIFVIGLIGNLSAQRRLKKLEVSEVGYK